MSVNKKSQKYLAKRAAKRKATQAAQTPSPTPLGNSPRSRWIRVAKWLLVVGTGLVASVYTLVDGPPWPTALAFSPGPPIFAKSALDVPFDVENKSVFFGFSNLTLTCHIIRAKAVSSRGNDLDIQGPFVRTADSTNTLAPRAHGSYTCPFRYLANIDGENAADVIKSVEIGFVSEYDRRLFWGRSRDEDGPFTLDMNTTPPHWVRGEMLK
jgi:hypothetical protein